jgi:hypothetical protein
MMASVLVVTASFAIQSKLLHSSSLLIVVPTLTVVVVVVLLVAEALQSQ